MKIWEKFEAVIEKLAFWWEAVVKIDWFVIFIKWALPWQTIKAFLSKKKKNHWEAKVIEVLNKSPLEIEAKCKHFWKCWGCTWQNLKYETQLEFKEKQVHECLKWISNFEFWISDKNSILPSPKIFEYRNKVELSFWYEKMSVEKDGTWNKTYNDTWASLWFHKKWNWQEIVEIENCELISKEANKVLNIFKKWCLDQKDLQVYNPYSHKWTWRHLLIKENLNWDILINLIVQSEEYHSRKKPHSPEVCHSHDTLSFPRRRESLPWDPQSSWGWQMDPQSSWGWQMDPQSSWGWQKSELELQKSNWEWHIISRLKDLIPLLSKTKVKSFFITSNNSLNDDWQDCDPELIFWEKTINEKILNLNFAISPKSFFQTNSLWAEVLYSKVKDYALSWLNSNDEKIILDLYCWTWTIGQILASCFNVKTKIIWIESIQSAVDDAKINANLNKLTNSEFICSKVEKILPDIILKYKKIDLAIIDPPRCWMHKKALETLLSSSPKQIIYVSCNPSTFSRDFDSLKEKYDIQDIQVVDMFPHTTHIEMIWNLILKEIN